MPDDWTPVRRLACALLALAALLARLAYYHVASHRAGEFPRCHDGSPILVGTHHKTGTLLLAKVFRVASRLMGVPRYKANANRTACDRIAWHDRGRRDRSVSGCTGRHTAS